jgi:hypothetical protein
MSSKDLLKGLSDEIAQLRENRAVLERQREDIVEQQKEIDAALEAAMVLLAYKSKQSDTPVQHDLLLPIMQNGKGPQVPLVDKITQMLTDDRDLAAFDRRLQYDTILARLRDENYDFGGKRDALSVNIALSKARNKLELTNSN